MDGHLCRVAVEVVTPTRVTPGSPPHDVPVTLDLTGRRSAKVLDILTCGTGSMSYTLITRGLVRSPPTVTERTRSRVLFLFHTTTHIPWDVN